MPSITELQDRLEKKPTYFQRVAEHLANGESIAGIVEDMDISEETARQYVDEVLREFGLENMKDVDRRLLLTDMVNLKVRLIGRRPDR